MINFIRQLLRTYVVAIRMRLEFEKIGEIKETHSLRVSQQGEGLYLYLPKGLTEVHGIRAGDRIKATLRDLFRPKMGNVTPSEKRCIPKERKEEEE